MSDKPVAKGRGALIESIRRHKEAQAAAEAAAAAGVGVQETETSPPKSRGRAALLQRVRQLKEHKAGGDGDGPAPGSSKSEASSIRGEESDIGQKLESVTQSVSKLSIGQRSQEADKSRALGRPVIAPPTPKDTKSADDSLSDVPKIFKGTEGRPLRSTANYINLNVEKDRGVYEYEVRFEPEVDAKSNRFKLVNQHLGPLAMTKVYDGDFCLYLPSQKFEGRTEFPGILPNSEDPVVTTFIYKRKKRLADCLHLYNVLFKRIMHTLLFSRIGRNYFNPEHKHLIPQHKLEVLPGYAVTVDEREGGLMVCLDTEHRVIRSQTVYEHLRELVATDPQNFRNVAAQNVIGSVILTRYNNKTYVVDDIVWTMSPKDTFQMRSGDPCSFIDYYKKQHGLTIEDHDQPLLVSKQKMVGKEDCLLCLVPELSYLTGLSDALRSDHRVMKDVAAFTRITPHQRMMALKSYLKKVRESEKSQEILAGWGLSLAPSTVDCQARVLPMEDMQFKNNKSGSVIGGNDWSKAIGEYQVVEPMDLRRWIVFHVSRDANYAQNYVDLTLRCGRGMGCVIQEPKRVVLRDDRSETYLAACRDNITEEVQAVVFICPTMRADRYAVIKKMCCTQYPIASQVILSKTLSNKAKVQSIVLKIALQINCKLGGALWRVPIPFKRWMICGIDVFHSPQKKSSTCGFVASVNDTLTQWFSEVVFQEKEIGDFFKIAFGKSLGAYMKRMGDAPQRIVIFRDGVGNGQLEHVKNYEVLQFQEVLNSLNISATITYVVVQKRINTRIFEVDRTGNCMNPPSGTVVDSMCTRRNYKDFYLIPQSVKQGTVNPSHYIIVHDDAGFKPEHLERLAYKLCHLYYNWSGTIRIPAPCQYAHKLAALIGDHVKASPHKSLPERLYYL